MSPITSRGHRPIPTAHLALLLGLLLLPAPGRALTISDTPLFLVGSVQPLVMLDISKDQQLYKKAYNDYSDLDGDGQVETTYKHSIDYYGYFDPKVCYTYSSANKRFEPAAISLTKYCSTQWSGNFLNWAAMSRMDAVRKLLYGGLRSPNRTTGDGNPLSDGDTASSTVLERAYLPNDAHSWAKYYDGTDLNQLTPYSVPTTATTSTTNRNITNDGSNTVSYTFTLASASGYAINDYVQVVADASNYLKGRITGVSGSDITISVANANYAGSGPHNSWNVDNLSKRGITLCNTTLGGGSPQDKSQTNTNLPRLRVAAGNYSLWSANERWQCRWSGEVAASNSNDFAQSGVPAGGSNPGLVTNLAGGLGDFFVRVQACVSGLSKTEKCKTYSTSSKPIGLLQVYGDTDQIRFGLMTGSYDNNISGGVLRKNTSAFSDEVNVASNGTFTSTVGIVKTLDKMRIYGYYYGDGTYLGSNGDNCGFQLTSITEGNCTSWGNPMSELYFESLRYFAGQSATTAYTSASTKDTALGLPRPSWTAPLTNDNYCAPLNTLVFNASVSTNDFDLAGTDMAAINKAGYTAADLANTVGTGEGLPGHSYFIGSTSGSNNELCDAKTLSSDNLGSIKGICPEGPTLLGSYLMPGMAHHAHLNRIRSDFNTLLAAANPPDTTSLKVNTYGVQLATNVPRIPIALSSSTTPKVILQPAYRLYNSAPQGGGSLVDLKILAQTATADTATGTIYVNWEDSEQGGDYDQDMWGVIRYCLTTVAGGCGAGSLANTITVTTDAIAESTNQPQGFGYIITGTSLQDGPHFHSGIEGFNYTDPTGATACSNCQIGNAATSATYTLGTSTAQSLKDPLFYAAKWGGFTDLNKDNEPNGTVDQPTLEWDVLKADGTAVADGLPDNYFLVSNPLGLETALNAAFRKILQDASASAVATNSTSLNSGTRIYQGRFSSSFWTGQLLSYRLNELSGEIISAASAPHQFWPTDDTTYPEWDAGQKINAQAQSASDDREIITRGASGGVAFQYANLSPAQQAYLNQNTLHVTDNCGQDRVAYLRGQSSKEGTGTFICTGTTTSIQQLRPRNTTTGGSILGDIVNSTPAYVGAPAAGYSDINHPGYSAFRANFLDRRPMVYVGANDGMLHGFNVKANDTNAGTELLAYVPTPVYENLSLLTDSNYKSTHKYFVDASPMVADACISANESCSTTWRTVLVGGLGAGGKGYFALNVTNPDDATKTTASPIFNESNAASLLLWEFTDSDDADLGYTYNLSPVRLNNGQAKQIVKFENGRWGVVVGNGYNSTSGKAALYVLFLSGPTGGTTPKTWQSGGTDYVKIVADAPVALDNGLSTPMPFDADGDGLADTVYAGDLKGNLWKFNLTSSDPASWAVALSGTPLFAAGATQPITSSPEVTVHPLGGQMVVFGTGKYLETGDSTSTTIQALYGIHDAGAAVASKSDLTPQDIDTIDITTTTEPIVTRTYRTITIGCDSDAATALPACPTASKGWYIDLDDIPRERATGYPKLVAGTVLLNTFIPSDSPCDFGGTGWLMALKYLTGEMVTYAAFDTSGDTVVGAGDVPVAGIEVGAAVGGTTIILPSPTGGSGSAVSSTLKGETVTNPFKPSTGALGRINWREIIQ